MSLDLSDYVLLVLLCVYWPHHAREQRPFREDTAGETLELLRSSKVKKGDSIFIMGDMNSRMSKSSKSSAGKLTGQFSPHHREDDGGTIMREICEVSGTSGDAVPETQLR